MKRIFFLVVCVFLIGCTDELIAEPSHPLNGDCTSTLRDADCSRQLAPVCGWFDGEKIQCFTYPCAQTYSNSCFACRNPDVLSFTEGECPSP